MKTNFYVQMHLHVPALKSGFPMSTKIFKPKNFGIFCYRTVRNFGEILIWKIGEI